jgi:F420-dependent oxidoreductase-like protein
MRFGIKTAPQHTTYADMLAVWRAADDIELFESAWTFDHFYPIFSDDKGPCMEAWTTTTALAQATERIRVGVMVTGNVYRHPAVLANMVASTDIISNGRLEFGFGAGWNQQECDAYGIPLPPLKERFDRFDEALEVIHKLLTEEEADFDGKYYKLTAARNEPKPVQKPRPPFVIGGLGEKRTLRSVAKWGDHWNFPGGGVDVFTSKRDVLAKHCADIGRDVNEIVTSTHLRMTDPNDFGAMVDEAAALGEAGLDLGVVYLPPPHTPAVLEPLAKALGALA